MPAGGGAGGHWWPVFRQGERLDVALGGGGSVVGVS